MRLLIHTGIENLTDNSPLEKIKEVVDNTKKYISVWHRQDKEDIYWAHVDWDGGLFACLMKDESYRFARLDLDEDGDGCVNRYFNFIDLPENVEYETDDIDMWCMLPWNPDMYISGVELDGKEIQCGPQSADKFKKGNKNG